MSKKPVISIDVIVVGSGPTGLTLANLLAKMGVKVSVIEQNEKTVSEPRAVSIDDEALRVYQSIGLKDKLRETHSILDKHPTTQRHGTRQYHTLVSTLLNFSRETPWLDPYLYIEL